MTEEMFVIQSLLEYIVKDDSANFLHILDEFDLAPNAKIFRMTCVPESIRNFSIIEMSSFFNACKIINLLLQERCSAPLKVRIVGSTEIGRLLFSFGADISGAYLNAIRFNNVEVETFLRAHKSIGPKTILKAFNIASR